MGTGRVATTRTVPIQTPISALPMGRGRRHRQAIVTGTADADIGDMMQLGLLWSRRHVWVAPPIMRKAPSHHRENDRRTGASIVNEFEPAVAGGYVVVDDLRPWHLAR